MNTNTLTLNFHGTDLFIVEHDGQPYTPMKIIAEAMGVSWQGQHAKLSSNPERWGIKKILIPTLGELQEAVCMPLRKLAGWLSTISPNKVKPEIRETIIQYQNECDDALWEYWTSKQQPQYGLKQLPEPKTKKSLPGGLTLEMQDEIKSLIKERVETLPQERWRGASMQLWGSIKKKFSLTKEQSYKDLSPEHYASCLSMLTRLELKGDPLLHVTPLELAALVDEKVKALEGELLPKNEPVQNNGINLKFESDEPQKLLVSVGPLGTSITKLLPDEMVIKKGQFYIMERKDSVSARKLVLDFIPDRFLLDMIETATGKLRMIEAGKLQA